MARQDVDAVRANYDAYSRHDYAAARRVHHPDVEFDTSRTTRPDGRVSRGREGMAAADREWSSMWTDRRTEVMEIRDLGDGHVLVRGELSGTSRETGIRLERPFVALHRVRDGLIVSTAFFDAVADALAAAGR